MVASYVYAAASILRREIGDAKDDLSLKAMPHPSSQYSRLSTTSLEARNSERTCCSRSCQESTKEVVLGYFEPVADVMSVCLKEGILRYI